MRSSTVSSTSGFSWCGSVARSNRSEPKRCGPSSGDGLASILRVRTPLVKPNGSARDRSESSAGVNRPRMRVGMRVCSYSGRLVSSWHARM